MQWHQRQFLAPLVQLVSLDTWHNNSHFCSPLCRRAEMVQTLNWLKGGVFGLFLPTKLWCISRNLLTKQLRFKIVQTKLTQLSNFVLIHFLPPKVFWVLLHEAHDLINSKISYLWENFKSGFKIGFLTSQNKTTVSEPRLTS